MQCCCLGLCQWHIYIYIYAYIPCYVYTSINSWNNRSFSPHYISSLLLLRHSHAQCRESDVIIHSLSQPQILRVSGGREVSRALIVLRFSLMAPSAQFSRWITLTWNSIHSLAAFWYCSVTGRQSDRRPMRGLSGQLSLDPEAIKRRCAVERSPGIFLPGSLQRPPNVGWMLGRRAQHSTSVGRTLRTRNRRSPGIILSGLRGPRVPDTEQHGAGSTIDSPIIKSWEGIFPALFFICGRIRCDVSGGEGERVFLNAARTILAVLKSSYCVGRMIGYFQHLYPCVDDLSDGIFRPLEN